MFYGYKVFNAPKDFFFNSGLQELFLSISIFLPVIGIGIYPDFDLHLFTRNRLVFEHVHRTCIPG
ncbi:hypothetical protein EJD97_014541 [Solanum chilense]|uniref:NADH:quinone oxidoreductase/Mrp antiporter membrane subunit domain-containing protein n=1 Tax=Solanum chilense TaxID=4083 RepID=A0A6N2CAD3_SOLCI|nr:hypothetical protein EJD97_014541 [Solanum chilense]